MTVTHNERYAFPWMPLFSHPPSPGGSVLHYLQIWNDEWKVKTCIIGKINKASFICRLTFTMPALFFGILKWELHDILRVFLMNFSGTETLLCLKAFSFLDSQGTKTLPRLPGFSNMMSPGLTKEQVLCWWRNGSGQFLRKEVSALPSLPLHSSPIIYPGLHHPLLRCLWSSSPWDAYRRTIHFSI